MPEDRASRQRMRNRRQSVRQAQAATRTALSELPPSQRSRIGTATRPILRQTQEFLAISTSPSITFATGPSGRLTGSTRTIRGTARHEVAHHLGAGHTAIRAATGGLGGLSRQQTQRAVRAQALPPAQRLQRAVKTTAARRSRRPPFPFGPRPEFRGFQTQQLVKVATTGTSTQQSRAREQMRRLGRRLRGRVDF
jgi:hypothetical protein